MSIHPITQAALDRLAASHDASQPIFMLNLWRFRPTAVYSAEHAHLSPAPCSGREATARYREAIRSVLPPGASVHFMGNVEGFVAGPSAGGESERESESESEKDGVKDGAKERWDWVAVVRYESLQGFRDMVLSREYKEKVEPHRLAGLEDWRLVAMEGLAVDVA